jgi:hypothetical protein
MSSDILMMSISTGYTYCSRIPECFDVKTMTRFKKKSSTIFAVLVIFLLFFKRSPLHGRIKCMLTNIVLYRLYWVCKRTSSDDEANEVLGCDETLLDSEVDETNDWEC